MPWQRPTMVTTGRARLAAQATVAALLLGALLLSCDALVGGDCAEGYRVEGSSCVPAGNVAGGGQGGSASGGGGGAGFHAGGGTAAGGAGASSSGTSSGTGGSGSCTPPLSYCPGAGCVDLDSDISNCGSCGVHCPTELCVAGECIGVAVGHSIVIGMSFEQYSIATRRLLGNAIFRPLHTPVRIVAYQQHAPTATVQAVQSAIDTEGTQRGRSFEITVPEPPTLPAALASGYYDLLLIHDQPLAPLGALASVGQGLHNAAQAFLQNGGTVVTLASAAGSGEMCELLTTLDVLPCGGLSDITGQLLYNVLPTDILGNNVPSPLLAKLSAASFVDAKQPGPLTAYVFNTAGAAPVVLHLVTQP